MLLPPRSGVCLLAADSIVADGYVFVWLDSVHKSDG